MSILLAVMCLLLPLSGFSGDERNKLQAVFNSEEYLDLKKMVTELKARFPPDQYFYVGIGRSPTAVIAFLQNLGITDAINLPISGFYGERMKPETRTSPPNWFRQILYRHFSRFLPSIVHLAGRKLLLIDFAVRGRTLTNVTDAVDVYYQQLHGQKKFTESLALVGSMEQLEINYPHDFSIDIPERLRPLFHKEIFKRFSEFIHEDPELYDKKDLFYQRQEYKYFLKFLFQKMVNDPSLVSDFYRPSSEIARQLNLANAHNLSIAAEELDVKTVSNPSRCLLF